MARLVVVEDFAGPTVARRGGQAIRVLQILEALRRLGHDVLFVEYLDEPPPPAAVAYFHEALRGRWSAERAAILDATTGAGYAGVASGDVASFAARADALVVLAAHYRREPWPLLEHVRPRILFEQDPGYTHLWAADGDPAEIFGEHDVYFTVGANIGTPRCALPTVGIDWHPLWPPTVLDWWPVGGAVRRDRFTTIGVWRDYGYLEFDGQVLGPKVEEFERFMALPRQAGEEIELTLAIDADDPDLPRLRDAGWRLEDPELVATPDRYVDYIAGSLGEFSCAKGGYVGTRSGWFSDRSASYLASGRPVVVQATGFEDLIPTGDGVFAVRDVDEAVAAMAEIRADYARHSRAARRLAEEFFDAERLMAGMLRESGVL